MASVDRKRGYLTSSFTILSNTSSSSSPGKGDYNVSNKNPTSIKTGLKIIYNLKQDIQLTTWSYSLKLNFPLSQKYTVLFHKEESKVITLPPSFFN